MPRLPATLADAPAARRLASLAPTAPDLTTPGVLTPARVGELVCRGRHFDLLYATQRVDAAILDALQDLADQCDLVGQFRAMRRGAVLNRIEGYPSENRQVLHTACRDVFDDVPAEPAASAAARAQLARLRTFLGELEAGTLRAPDGAPFRELIHVGIGGSDLGPRALYTALGAYLLPGRRVHFVANVDPDDASAVLREADLAHSLVAVVSKSGTTLETRANEERVRAALRGAGLVPEHHVLAVTGQGSPMDDPARYLRSFHMYDAIGGRYSSTSMVGAVPLGFALGYPGFEEVLRGAHEADREAEEPAVRRNPALLLALLGVWNRNLLGHDTVAVLPYSQALARFPAHLQQCDMESNGKSVTRRGEPVPHATGPVVWGEPGTNGQHAFFQLLHQGTTVVPAEFIGFRRSQYGEDQELDGTTAQEKLLVNLLAQALALATGQRDANPNRSFPGNRPSSVLMGERLTPRSLGALLALYEAKIVFQGFLWGINSFDQEGVQLGKVLATRLLGRLAAGRGAAETPPAGQAQPVDAALLAAAGLAGTRA